MKFRALSLEAIRHILGCNSAVPLSISEMARALRVAFYPSNFCNEKLQNFLSALQSIFERAGVEVLSYEDALREGEQGKVGKGITLIAPGEGDTGNLAIDHVTSLTENTVIGVHCGYLPRAGQTSFQKRIDALVSALVWNMVHIIIYVEDDSWTICTMNGSICSFLFPLFP